MGAAVTSKSNYIKQNLAAPGQVVSENKFNFLTAAAIAFLGYILFFKKGRK